MSVLLAMSQHETPEDFWSLTVVWSHWSSWNGRAVRDLCDLLCFVLIQLFIHLGTLATENHHLKTLSSPLKTVMQGVRCGNTCKPKTWFCPMFNVYHLQWDCLKVGGGQCSPGRGTILLDTHIQTCRSFWSFLLSRFGVLVTKSFSMLLRDNWLQNENASRKENIHVPGEEKKRGNVE